MDEEFGDEDYCYYSHHRSNKPCMGKMPPKVLTTIDFHPAWTPAKSLDNICHFDVYWNVKQVINFWEVIVTEVKYFQEKEISKTINMMKKIEGKVKITLQMNLKNLLKLPDIVVTKIMDFLLNQSVSDYDVEVVKFEEWNENDRVRRILLKVYDYFFKVVDHVRKKLVEHRCKCGLPILLFHIMQWLPIQLDEMVEEDGNDWIEYFGIDQETIEDIWEDEKLEAGKLF